MSDPRIFLETNPTMIRRLRAAQRAIDDALAAIDWPDPFTDDEPAEQDDEPEAEVIDLFNCAEARR